ncbi:hypothetical protein C2S52_002997 [Perilla frutescens var. hirtella]|uniref:Uncharacterized protein n=1 Tax=Perilla frutescens var. hirtella TaxID=608512 RepID=A0AAD4P990_PERFH|nr:hypothetical protein C2S51_012465 [Perilla frutescens var. frutescens]KAH6792520.1 hypothetical protein C2S52_002997 [Perilla frutescens var. hirtella]KAH6830981.1 hypothetical protein C2S53_006747 [Perilla frutescens var. hirtella]
MQRQSLGSPSSKLVKDEQLPSQSTSSSSSSASTLNGLLYGEECEEEEELKKLKPKSPMPQSYIHLIPILTLLCFLILYLSSHDPSLNDLAEFNGVKTTENIGESHENISELQRILEIEKGDILAIRSLKNLKQEADAAKHRRLHRKIAHF